MAISYVGGRTQTHSGTGTTFTVSLNGTLTGGSNSSPSANDLVIVTYAIGQIGSFLSSMSVSGNNSGVYNVYSGGYANDTRDASARMSYKIQGASVDTTLTLNANNNTNFPLVVAISVWRGVDTTTPIDASVTAVSTTNTRRPSPPTIIPVTAGAVIVHGAFSTSTTTDTDTYANSSGESLFFQDARVGGLQRVLGYMAAKTDWTSGSYTPATDTGVNVNASDSNVSYTLAIRPSVSADPISNLYDNFNDNSLDGAKWWEVEGGTTTITETNNRMEVALPSSATSSDYGEIDSVNTYDLTGSSLHIETIATPSSSTAANAVLYIYADSSNWFRWVLESGTLYAQRRNAGVKATVASVTFNSTTHKWWRIREASGVVYYDTSSDGLSWTNQGTYTHGMTITAMKAIVNGSCYQNETNPGSFVFDNFNVTDTPVTLGFTSLSTTLCAPSTVLGTVLTPGIASLALTSQMPTVMATNNQTITTASPSPLILSPQTPAVVSSDNKVISLASPSALTTTLYAPTVAVSQNYVVTPGTATLTTSTFSVGVAVSDNQAITPNTASFTTTLYAPTVTSTDNKTAVPGTASLTLTSYEPTAVVESGNVEVAPDIASLTLTLLEPTATVTNHVVVTPGLANIVTAIFEPSVSVTANTTVTPGMATLRTRTSAPIVNGEIPSRDYYIDSDGNIFWVINQDIGLVEKV